MLKKIGLLLVLLATFACSYFIFTEEKRPEFEDISISEKIENPSIEFLLTEKFEENKKISVGQVLVFYSRIFNNNVKTYQEAQEFAELKGILLPSKLVYNKEDWETVWRENVIGNAVFEKVNEDTYSLALIKDYLTIYLNEYGYKCLKGGLVPPQLYFYSPFSDITDLEEINIEKDATLGFVLEIFTSFVFENDEGNKEEEIRKILINKVEDITGKKEEEWGNKEKDIFNYYSLSYFGEYTYLINNGYIEGIDVKNLTNSVSTKEFLKYFDAVIEKKLSINEK